jgi:hypothetical protein
LGGSISSWRPTLSGRWLKEKKPTDDRRFAPA